MVGHERFAQGFDDRDAPGCGGFKKEGHLLLGGERENLFSVLGEEGFVGGDDDFALPEGGHDEFVGVLDAAHEFHDHLHLRIVDEVLPVGAHDGAGRVDATPGPLNVQVCNLFNGQLKAEPFTKQPAVADEMLVNAHANGAEARDADADFSHIKYQFATIRATLQDGTASGSRLPHLNDSHAKAQRREASIAKKLTNLGKTGGLARIFSVPNLCAFAALRESFSVAQFSNVSRLF